MHKSLLGAALAMGALLAGGQIGHVSQQASASQEPDLAKTRQVATESWPASVRTQKPGPTKPASLVAKQRVELIPRSLALLDAPVRFVERPGRRKVKYGKNRWIILS